ncbi:MAG: ATP-binding protein [Lentisphaerota bacterium]
MALPTLEENLRLAQRMEAVGHLAGGLAHDFNNILSGVLGYASYLKMKADPSESLYGDLVLIEQSAERAAELTRKLMTFSPNRSFIKGQVFLNQVIDDALLQLKPSIPAGITVTKELAENLPSVAGDRQQLQMVVTNLCTNAIEAMVEKGGVLTVHAEFRALSAEERASLIRIKDPKCVCMTISDTGRGMKADVKTQIFDPFFSTKIPRKGAGLGLSAAYGIMAAHQGDITAESEEGNGSVFRIYLQALILT